MSEQIAVQPALGDKNHGWRVTFAGMGINLALGVLYTWSVISKGIPDAWAWSEAGKSLPYSIACLIFSIVMVPAGRIQDRFSPRMVATIGGFLVGAGMIIASLTTSTLGFVLGFGVLAGSGIGFGYASATPPAVKWFPAAKTGMVAGIVVSGFGLASVYAAPLASELTRALGIQSMMLIFGIGFFVIVVGLAQLLQAPKPGFIHPADAERIAGKAAQKGPVKKEEFTPKEMLKTWQFYVLWFAYACGAGAGLMVISKLASIAKIQANLELGFILVASLAIGNGGGRILAGIVSDKIGRKWTLLICFLLQAGLILLLALTKDGNFLATIPVMIILSALIGANYGANLSIFPSVTKDFYGVNNFGTNYGLVFTAWGVGGFMLSLLAGRLYDVHQTFAVAYYGACILLLLAAVVSLFIKPPHHLETK